MIISVHAYVVMGSSLNVTVSTVDDTVGGVDRRPSFFGRSVIPLGAADINREDELVFAVGEELLNLAYGYGATVQRGTGPRADQVPE